MRFSAVILACALIGACRPPERTSEPPRIGFVSPNVTSDLDEGEAFTVEVQIDDPDDDAPITVELSVNGVVFGTDTLELPRAIATFNLTALPAGAMTLRATADDGVAEPSAAEDTFQVNSRPAEPTLVLTPAWPADDSDLTADVAEPVWDPDGDGVDVAWRWSRDGGTGLTGTQLPAVLPEELTAFGEVWTFELTLSERTQPREDEAPDLPLTRTVSGTVTVNNEPPSLPVVGFSPVRPTPLQPLTCAPADSVDPQGFPVSFTFAWRRDRGAGIELQESRTTDTIPHTAIQADDRWFCDVIATDGEAEAEQVTGDVYVRPSPGEVREASVVLAPNGASIRHSPRLIDVDGDGRLDHLIAVDVDADDGAGALELWSFSALLAGTVLDDSPDAVVSSFVGYTLRPSLLVAGDLTGDGRPELVASATSETGDAIAWVVDPSTLPTSGSALISTLALRIDGGVDLGLAATVGDFAARGYPQLAVADTDLTGTSAVRIYDTRAVAWPGRLGGDDAVATVVSSYVRDGLGRALAAGALSGPGAADVVIGIPRQTDIGEVTCAVIFTSGAVAGGGVLLQRDAWTMIQDDTGSGCGDAVLTLPDYDGDGDHELMIGSPNWRDDRGRVALIAGGLAAGSVVDLRAEAHPGEISGPQGTAQFGGGLVNLGDVNADGWPELAIEAHTARGGDGRVYIYDGARIKDLFLDGVQTPTARLYDYDADWILEGDEAAGLRVAGPMAPLDEDAHADLALFDLLGTTSLMLTGR